MLDTQRNKSYQAIDEEINYAAAKWDGKSTPGHSITEWLVYIRDYTDEALRGMTRLDDAEANTLALNQFRKIAGLAVSAMEQHGVQRRADEGARPVGFTAI